MTAPETRWTAETEELVASRGAGSFAARDILAALANAGLLLPSGGVNRDEDLTFNERVTVWPDGTALTGPWIEVPS